MKNKISVIVPIYNELKNLPKLLERLHESLSKIGEYELIFIDDHSTDKTDAYFKKFKANNIFLHLKKGKKGKAYSLMEGFEKATGDVLVMIDADLQYPPEVMEKMLEKLKDADIVVANRVKYNDSLARRILSKTFRKVFGQYLFGINSDIQSGMKMFKKEVVDYIKFVPSSGWTFDLEFLHRANHAGFKIANFDITFEKRKEGASSVRFIKTTFDIGLNSLLLRLKTMRPLIIVPKEKMRMLGAGIRHKKQKYVTHTTLSHHKSALTTFTLNQKVIIFFLILYLLIGLLFKPLLTLQLAVGILSFIYFIDVFFNLYLIIKSLSFPQEVSSSQSEIESLKDKDLPIYSILCPLYKESHVIPQFLDAISKLDWPKEKLDVILLLEEDDKTSIEAVEKMEMPSFVRTIVVPDSMPKTKPKACNYGLAFAKGEYLVIYDAEDIPDPLQLKKAFLGFQKVSDKTICLQAKLNYYNPNQNLLTRFFTAEYSLWFDVTLTGLQSIETTIPLGGTSNHFRIKYLHEVEGWDPFNVTEDADLGIRLFRRGYKTAIIDSVTLEEANSRYKNWLRQRSRWIKGYMQTYLVHVRDLFGFAKDHKKHSLIFQLIIGGKIAFVLINPILWIATFAYFALYAFVGPQIEKLYPSIVFYMAVVSLVLGNFLFLYYYMIGVAKKGQWGLMKYVFLIPIYWLMISIAAVIALYQLIFKPHYWEKTIHGLHIYSNEIGNKDRTVFALTKENYLRKVKLNFSKFHFDSGILIFANALASFINLLFNAYLGRVLSFEGFAVVSLVNSLLSLTSIIFGSLGTTVSHKTSYLMGKFGENAAIGFWREIRQKFLKISFALFLIWIILSPFMASFFKLLSVTPFIYFSFIILFSLVAATDRGLLFSQFKLRSISLLTIIEPIIKFSAAFGLVIFGYKYLSYSSIPLSIVLVFFIGLYFVYKNKVKGKSISGVNINYKFPWKFFAISLLSGVSVILFLNIDVILAKHYLSASDAGIYSLTSLIGKMVYFFGTLASPFTIPFVSRNDGANKDSKKFLNTTVVATFILSGLAFLMIFVFGKSLIPFVFGAKAILTLPYINFISFAMIWFSVARVYSEYYLAKKHYSITLVAFIIGVFQVVLIDEFHSGIWSFVYVMSFIWIFYFISNFVMHTFSSKINSIEDWFFNAFKIFHKDQREEINHNNNRLNVLIFNWRDTKHRWSGGAEVYINELAKRWVKDGNNVSIFCGNDGKSTPTEQIDGIKIYRRGGFYGVYFWAFIYYLFIFRGKYDVIIDSENGIPFFTPLFSRLPKFLLIHHVHQEVFRKSLKWPLSWIALFLEAKLMPIIYRQVQIITVSPSSKTEILKHNLTKKEPIIIYNGVNLNIFKPHLKNKTPLILYLGRLQYYKSLHVFIVAAKRILKKTSSIEFIIAGEGEEKEKLIRFAKDQGIIEKIKFIGKVSEEEKVNLYQKAWVFVNPSFMEGWGITTIEANACATPAVASNVPGLKDSIKDGETGILVRYGKYSSFSKNIHKLITDDKFRNKMSTNARKWSEQFDWDNSADKFFLILVDAVTQSKQKKVKLKNFEYVLNRITSMF